MRNPSKKRLSAGNMNQINLDSLLNIAASIKIEQQLKLDPTQLYQALLKIGDDGGGQLQVNTGAQAIRIALSPANIQQLAAAQQSPASSQVTLSTTASSLTLTPETAKPAQPLSTTLAINHLAAAKTSETVLPTPMNESRTAQSAGLAAMAQMPSQAALTETIAVAKSDNKLSLLQNSSWQVKLQPLQNTPLSAKPITAAKPSASVPEPAIANQPLLLQLQKPAQLVSVSEAAIFNLFRQASQQLSKTNHASDSPQLAFKVQISRHQERLLVSLDASRPQLAITLAQFQEKQQQPLVQLIERWPLQYKQQALLTVANRQGEITLSLKLDPRAAEQIPDQKQQVIAADKTQLMAAAQPAVRSGKTTEAKTTEVLTLNFTREQVKSVLPALGKQVIHQNLSPENLGIPSPTPQRIASEQWQLRQPPKAKLNETQWHVEIQSPSTSLKITTKDLEKPVAWQSVSASLVPTKLNISSAGIDVPALWRQLLPLTSAPDPLQITQELPKAVQAILHEIKANTLDHHKVPSASELQSQLTAALQFNPLQSLPNPATAAGSLALALQLLIGRLASSASDTARPMAGKEKMQQLVGQLNESQSSQLLKQLASHSAQIQQAQLATIDPQAQQKSEHTQLFVQLPLIVQGQHQFVEMAISEREADGSQQGKGNKAWQLTMKFQLGEQGHLLVQVVLQGVEVRMQFYAETEQAQQLTDQWLGIFKERLHAQGLEIKDIQVQRGKIPAHLYQRGTSLLQIKV